MGVFNRKNKGARDARRTKRDDRQDKRKAVISTAKNKVKSKVREQVKKGKAMIKSGVSVGALLPFRPVMVAVLKQKNIEPKKDLQELAVQFYQNVVKRDSYDAGDAYNQSNPYRANDNLLTTSTDTIITEDSIDPVTISAITQAVMKWIKGLRAKKALGQPLSKTQEQIVDASETVEESGNEFALDAVEEETGEAVMKYAPYIVGSVLAAVALYFIFKALK